MYKRQVRDRAHGGFACVEPVLSSHAAGFVTEGRPTVWPPAWREVSPGSLGGGLTAPSGELEQPFLDWTFCVDGVADHLRTVTVETLSHAKGESSTGLFVGHLAPQPDGAPPRLEPMGFGRTHWECVRDHLTAEAPTDGACADGSRPVQLATLEFTIAATDLDEQRLRGFTGEDQCFRAYVLLRREQRSVSDVGLSVSMR